MSQHRFNRGKLEILAGWDKPLQHFFLVVEKEEKDDPIYSNIFDSSANGLEDCSYFKMKLAELGCPPHLDFGRRLKQTAIIIWVIVFGFGVREPSNGVGRLHLGETGNTWLTDAPSADRQTQRAASVFSGRSQRKSPLLW